MAITTHLCYDKGKKEVPVQAIFGEVLVISCGFDADKPNQAKHQKRGGLNEGLLDK